MTALAIAGGAFTAVSASAAAWCLVQARRARGYSDAAAGFAHHAAEYMDQARQAAPDPYQEEHPHGSSTR